MADYQNTYETGLASGTALTVANSDDNGAGDAFAAVSGGTQQFATANVLFGTRSVTVAAAASTAAYHAWQSLVDASPAFTFDAYFYMPSVPVTNDQVLCAFYRGATGVAPCLIRTNGSIRLTSDAGGGTSIIASAAGIFNAAGWYRVSIWGTANGASGNLHMRAWSVNPTTFAETELFTQLDSTTANLGTGNVDAIRIGRSVGFGPAYTWTFNVVRGRGGAATPFTAFAFNTPPVVDAGPDRTVEPWSTVTLAATVSDDGLITSRQWTQTGGTAVTLTGDTTDTATYEAPATIAGSTQTFSYTATDDDGAPTTDSVTVTVLPVTERAAVGGVLVPLRIRA